MAADPFTSRAADELLRDHAAFDTDDEDLAERPPLNTERDDKAILSPQKRKAGAAFGDGIIEEEVKISKQRKKIPKLDTDKLLSEPGLPKIRSLLRSGQLKKKLRLKGKGHEFSDTARLLNFYQMWLDNLYPRAKFADAIQMVEKAGHTKKMQMYRKSWIDEGKPGHIRREVIDEAFANQDEIDKYASKEASRDVHQAPLDEIEEDPASMFFDGNEGSEADNHNGPDDDELDALLAQENQRTVVSSRNPAEVDSEGEDDLDAILAQAHSHREKPSPTEPRQTDDHESRRTEHGALSKESPPDNIHETVQASEPEEEPEDEDDLAALLAGNEIPSKSAPPVQPRGEFDEDDFPDDNFDDLDALLNNQEATSEPELPSNSSNKEAAAPTDPVPSSEEVPELDNIVSSSPIPNVHTDELDQLMDEHDAAIEQQKKKADPEIVEEFMSSSPIQSGV